MKVNNWKFSWINSWEEIKSTTFYLQWQSWYEQSTDPTVFNHPLLNKIWIETYLDLRKIDPHFCIAENKGTLVIFPLILWTRNWKNLFQKLLIPVGYSDYDYNSPLLINPTPEFSWPEFWQNFLNYLINKRPIPFDQVIIPGIPEEISGKGLNWSFYDISPQLELEPYYHTFDILDKLPASLRGDIRRQIRKLEKLGILNYIELIDINDALKELPSFLWNHKIRWPEAYKAPGFHEQLILNCLSLGLVHFSVLKISDESISWHLGFNDSKTFYYYMPAYNADYASYSPGKIHLKFLIESAIVQHNLTFDHLRGVEKYKVGWANRKIIIFSTSYINKSIRSRFINCLLEVKTSYL